MIKIEKDLTVIPDSLTKATTERHRQKCIDAGEYVDSDRYRLKDIKDALKTIYNNKCCYCEKDIGDSNQHVEHYRPKNGGYYWLAHSWDNLLLCCEICNQNKSNKFAIDGIKATYTNDAHTNIHTLSSEYNRVEQPFFINPEEEDVQAKLQFERSGKISSEDARVQYTITECKIDRESANLRRKSLIDDLQKDINARIVDNEIDQIPSLIKDFKRKSRENNREYLAFRQWAVTNMATLLTLG